jgi:hypothetical protein
VKATRLVWARGTVLSSLRQSLAMGMEWAGKVMLVTGMGLL